MLSPPDRKISNRFRVLRFNFGKRFFPSSTGITPNELVLIDALTPGGPISTGVMVLYAGSNLGLKHLTVPGVIG